MPESVSAMFVDDVMTCDVQTVYPETPMKHAATIMAEHQLRHLIVVDRSEKPVGILSERDLLLHVARCTARGQLVPGSVPIAELMVAATHTAASGMPLAEAASLMVRNAIDCLPVVDGQGALAGLVTSIDILKAVAACQPPRTGHRGPLSRPNDGIPQAALVAVCAPEN